MPELRIVSSIVLLVAFSSTGLTFAQAQGIGTESFLCVPDKATGFTFNKLSKEWISTNFRVPKKYLLTPSKDQGYSWDVKEVGSKWAFIQCESGFNEAGNLFCQGMGTEFRFNRKSLRFMSVYLIGYWNDGIPGRDAAQSDEGGNTPSIEIGKCSPL